MKFPEMLTGVQHIGVPTNDLEKTVAFYETIGFRPVLETVNEAANERVTFLQLKNLVIETYENHAAVGKPGAIDHIALDTTDVEAAFAAAKEAGLSHFQYTSDFPVASDRSVMGNESKPPNRPMSMSKVSVTVTSSLS